VRVAHFVQRYPPALGGSEAYFARLSRYLAGRGDAVTVFTTTALDLEGLWHTRGRGVRPGVTREEGLAVRRYRPVRCAGLPRLLRAADRVFAQTGVERDALLQCGLAPEKVVLQGLGVEPAECTGGDRDRARCAWGIAAKEVVIGHLANNSREKGTVDLLRA